MSVAHEHTRVRIACPHCGCEFRPAAKTRLNNPTETGPSPAGHPPVYPSIPVPVGTEQRSRIAAGLLGIFFGCLGLHRFYLGSHAVGLIQLCLTLGGLLIGPPLFCCTPIVAIWGFTEGVLCLVGWMTDGDGNPLGP